MCFSSTVGRANGNGPSICEPLQAVLRVQPCASFTSIRTYCAPSASVTEGFRLPSSTRLLHSQAVVPPSTFACGHLMSRGYKIITSCIVDLPKMPTTAGPKGLKQVPYAVGDSCNRITRWLHESRIPETWIRKKFYIKPKVRRSQKRWAGILKRKRRDFNYKLRWALKSMTR